MIVSPQPGRSALRQIRRAGPHIVLALILLLGALSVWQALGIARHLENDARETSHVFGSVIAALTEPEPGSSADLLLQVARDITGTGIPLILTDSLGRPTAAANLPFSPDMTELQVVASDDPRVRAYIPILDRANPPLTVPGGGQVHFGALPVGRILRGLAVLQMALIVTTVGVGVWAYRVAIDRNRERLWVAMARESAHQMGTPLMSAHAWVDRLAERDEQSREIAGHLSNDLERLQRVAQRFERIGRPARAERVALGAIAERVAAYFAPRLPQHANQVRLHVEAPAAGPMIHGDPVLLEWAIEALVRNAIDALSGRGGEIRVTVQPDDHQALVTVSDDGPGVPIDIRGSLFEPGVSTKPGGWGIGLALVRRIVEDVHGGRIELLSTSTGAAFRATLPAAPGA